MTKKVKEGMEQDLERTRTTLTYQLDKKERRIKQLMEACQVHVWFLPSIMLVYCIHSSISHQEDKISSQNVVISTLRREKEALELQDKTLRGEL